MQKVKSLVFTLIMLVLYISSSHSASPLKELILVGLTVQEKHQVPIFYAAIYAQNYQSEADLFDLNNPIRMESRIIVDSYSSRMIHQLWVGAILINTPREQLKPLANPFLKFSQLIKIDVVSGDSLIFDYQPNKGTSIYLNNTLVGKITDPDFQKALTSAWYGERPPSKIFGEEIRQQPSSKYLTAFNQLTPSKERLVEVKRQYAQAKKIATTKLANESHIEEKALSSSAQINKNTTQSKQSTVAEIKEEKLPEQKTVNKKEEPASIIKPEEQNKSTSLVSNPKIIDMEATSTKTADIESSSDDVFDNVINQLKQEYIEEVSSYIRSQARPKPPRSVRKTPDTSPQIKIAIIRNGNQVKVSKTTITNGQFHEGIEEAIYQSILSLKKIPPFPDAIEDKQLDIVVSIDFSRCKRATSAWICL